MDISVLCVGKYERKIKVLAMYVAVKLEAFTFLQIYKYSMP